MPPPLAAPTLGLPIPAEADEAGLCRGLLLPLQQGILLGGGTGSPAVFLREQIGQRAKQVQDVGILRLYKRKPAHGRMGFRPFRLMICSI